MDSAFDQEAAIERARWLARLAEAIDQAQILAWQLGVSEGDSDEARHLYGRLEQIRAEVDMLRRGAWPPAIDAVPRWIGPLLWPRGEFDSAS